MMIMMVSRIYMRLVRLTPTEMARRTIAMMMTMEMEFQPVPSVLEALPVRTRIEMECRTRLSPKIAILTVTARWTGKTQTTMEMVF
jgi:hypothetical protein